MSILGSIIDSIGVNSPRKAPSTRDRLASDLVAAEGLKYKRQQAIKLIKQTEADFANDLQVKLREDPTFDTSGINLKKPTLANYKSLYGEQKGLDIAINNTTIAQALLGDDIPGVSKKFNFNDLQKIQDPETGEEVFDLKVNVTNEKEGINYDTGLSFEGNSDNEQIAQDAESRGEDGVAAVENQTFRPTEAEIEKFYMSTRNALINTQGESTLEDLTDLSNQTFTSGYRQSLANSITQGEGDLESFMGSIDENTQPPPVSEKAGETKQDQTNLSTNQDRMNVLTSIDPTVAYSEEEIAEWPSGGTAVGGLSKSRKYKSVYIANQNAIQKLQNKGELSANEQGKLNRLLKSQQDTLNTIKQSAQNSYEALVKVENTKETTLTKEITSLEDQLKGKVSDKNREIIQGKLEALTKERDGITAKLGTKLPTKDSIAINQQVKKEYSITAAQNKAFKNAVLSGDKSKIQEALDAMTGGKPPSTELQKKMVAYLQNAKNNVRLVGIQKQANDNIVMAILAADRDLMANNMDTIISFAQTGTLDFQALINKQTADTNRMNVPKGDTFFRNKINDFQVLDDDGVLNKDLTELTGYGAQAIATGDEAGKLAYEVKGSQWVKEWAQANGNISFWKRIASFGQASGPDAAKFSIKSNIRLVDRGDGRPYFEFLDQNGAIAGATISVYQAGRELGPAGLELLEAMAGENKKSK